MRYQGGKTKQWKYIVPIIERYLRKRPNALYVEPFVGGGNIFTRVNHPSKLANDIDSDVIDMWKHFKETLEVPDHTLITKEFYLKLKNEDKTNQRSHPSWLYGFVSNACSYGGKKWGGFASINPNRGENHIREACASTQRQILEDTFTKTDVKFSCGDYHNIEIPESAVIYCDPPYKGTMGYGTDFNNDDFWDWCRTQAKRGCKVLVSEYSAPKDFRCIWKKKKKDGMGTTAKGKRQKTKIEKLFCYGNS